jgi:hypothetical protein
MMRFAAVLLLALATVGCASANETSEEAHLNEQGSSSATNYDSAEPPAEADPVTDAELREFAKLTRRVRTVQSEARAEIQAAESKEARQKLKSQTQKKVRGIFEDSSMSRERYDQIGKMMQSDPDLQERYRQQMRGQSR